MSVVGGETDVFSEVTNQFEYSMQREHELRKAGVKTKTGIFSETQVKGNAKVSFTNGLKQGMNPMMMRGAMNRPLPEIQGAMSDGAGLDGPDF